MYTFLHNIVSPILNSRFLHNDIKTCRGKVLLLDSCCFFYHHSTPLLTNHHTKKLRITKLLGQRITSSLDSCFPLPIPSRRQIASDDDV